MKFDVRTEAWIPVRTVKGEEKMVGLLELFQEAHCFQDIDGDTPMETYSLYRFLATFLMTVFRPETWEDKNELLSAGCFDMEKIKAYIGRCENKGISFDIFDVKRPFMQAVPDESLDTEKKIKYVAVLDSTRASGHNAIHFDHNLENTVWLGPAEAFREMLTAQIFCTAMTGGYPSNVNGVPPLFFLPQGNNLFETLVLAMSEVDEDEKIAGLPLWESNFEIVPQQEVTKTTQLYGMFFPSRRIRLIEQDGLVQQVYYQPGLHFTGFAAWNDPHVAYRPGKDNTFFSIKPSTDKEPWRNIKSISEYYDSGSVPKVVDDFYKIRKECGFSSMPVQIFGVVTSNAAYLDTQGGLLRLDARILGDEKRRAYAVTYIDMAEKVGYVLAKTLNKVISPDKSKRGNGDVSQYLHQYYMGCENNFYKVLQDLAACDNLEKENKLLAEWRSFLQETALNIVQEFEMRYCFQAADLIRAQQEKKFFFTSIKKILGEER